LAEDFKRMMETGQLVANVFLLRKCAHTSLMVKEWTRYSMDYHLIDDSPSVAPTPRPTPNGTAFHEHRHDQSIFSIIRKMYGTEMLTDETYTSGEYNQTGDFYYPFAAKRLKY